jgi:integrase
MIKLANGCSCSEPSVYPKNWASQKAKLSPKWYITYRFYDPGQGKPKQVTLKGMNKYKSLQERQTVTTELLLTEKTRLLKENYNPFKAVPDVIKKTGTTLPIHQRITQLHPKTPFMEALILAFETVTVAPRTKRDLRFMLANVEKSIKSLGLEAYEISSVTRKLVKTILEHCSTTPDQFNKTRSYLMILFSELCESEATEINPVRDVKKKKVIKKIRRVLTPDERKLVNEHLRESYPEFNRFLHIFFHSGCRISELLRIRGKDIEITNQRFRIVILKGSVYKEVYKTIKNIALPYWKDLMNECLPEMVVFSKGLKPGLCEIQPYQVTKRWYRLVKKKIGIEADFYSLKHSQTTETVMLLSEKEAAEHNSHTTTAMIRNVYDVDRTNREHERVKLLNNSF